MSSNTSDKPSVGSRWRHEAYRGVFTVQSVGRKYIYLKSSIPGFTKQVEIARWPGIWGSA